jgi:uncharacterized protein GlcG (DUF336 family)
MKRMVVLASFATLAAFQASGQAPTPAPSADVIPLSVVNEWADATIASCDAAGYKVTATFMNADFGIKLVKRADGAREMTVDVARRKAYTVIKTGMSSGEFGASVALPAGTPAAAPVAGLPGLPPGENVDKNLIVWAGALPVKIGAKIVGAVSVSGAPGGDKDEACAKAGLAKIAGKLN